MLASDFKCFDGLSEACPGLDLRFGRASPFVAMILREVENCRVNPPRVVKVTENDGAVLCTVQEAKGDTLEKTG